eukprot:scaffold152178_cov18-Prasinocladus_malaysianus.AAC.1
MSGHLITAVDDYCLYKNRWNKDHYSTMTYIRPPRKLLLGLIICIIHVTRSRTRLVVRVICCAGGRDKPISMSSIVPLERGKRVSNGCLIIGKAFYPCSYRLYSADA